MSLHLVLNPPASLSHFIYTKNHSAALWQGMVVVDISLNTALIPDRRDHAHHFILRHVRERKRERERDTVEVVSFWADGELKTSKL